MVAAACPPHFFVASPQRPPLRFDAAARRDVGEYTIEGLIGFRDGAGFLENGGEPQVGLDVVRLDGPNALPGSSCGWRGAEVEQRFAHFAPALDLPGGAAGFGRQKPEDGEIVPTLRAVHRLGELPGHRREARPILLAKIWERLKDGAVLTRIRRKRQSLHELIDRGGRRRVIVLEIAVGLEVERDLVLRSSFGPRLRDLGSDQDGVLGAQRMPDAELVEHVRVVDGDVRDDDVRQEELLEHVDADVAGFAKLLRGVARDPALFERGRDELRLHSVEVDALTGSKRPDDEGTHQRNRPK